MSFKNIFNELKFFLLKNVEMNASRFIKLIEYSDITPASFYEILSKLQTELFYYLQFGLENIFFDVILCWDNFQQSKIQYLLIDLSNQTNLYFLQNFRL